MQRQRRRTSILFFGLLLVQVLSPLAFAQAPAEPLDTDTEAEVDLLQQLDIEPSSLAEHGWLEPDQAAGTAALLYRDVSLSLIHI